MKVSNIAVHQLSSSMWFKLHLSLITITKHKFYRQTDKKSKQLDSHVYNMYMHIQRNQDTQIYTHRTSITNLDSLPISNTFNLLIFFFFFLPLLSLSLSFSKSFQTLLSYIFYIFLHTLFLHLHSFMGFCSFDLSLCFTKNQ